jgi:uncharacterized protein (TIGR04255 family)
MRWKLRGSGVFLSDPGLLPLIGAFTARVAKLGYPVHKDLAKPEDIIGYHVIRRYFTADDVSFPIIQIGQGVFASNQSSDYSWLSFRAQTLKALKVLLDSYPKLEGYPFEPEHLELRYIDVFDQSLLGTLDLIEFANRGTALNIGIPEDLFDKKKFTGPSDGRLILQRQMKNGTKFHVDFASGKNSATGEPTLRLESKVITQGLSRFRTPAKFAANIESWLTDAHDITSPFFRRFVSAEVMQKFN